jgi:hypothetical protein
MYVILTGEDGFTFLYLLVRLASMAASAVL